MTLGVLLVLVFPFLATIFVLSMHWNVQSGDVVLECNLVLIARRADEVLAFSRTVGGRYGDGLSGESLDLGETERVQCID
jgi:hypothetical protein